MEHIRAGWERWLGVAGVVYAILHFLYFQAANVVDLGATPRSIANTIIHQAGTTTWSGALQQAAALVALLLALGLRAHLTADGRQPDTLTSLILPAAAGNLVLTFVGSACTFILVHDVAKLGDANLTYGLLSLWWATLLAADVMLGIMVLGATISGLVTQMFSRWIGWLGIAAGIALVGGCLAFYPTGGVMQGPADGVAYIGENLVVVWAIASGVVILRGRRVTTTMVPQAVVDAAGAR